MSLRLNRDQLRQPHGGHQFPNSDGRILTGDTFEEVVDKLKQYRTTNGIDAGDPEQEVLRHYARHWPYMVEIVDNPKPERHSQAFYEWAYWVRGTWRKPPKKFITTKEAGDRWAVCLECPFNKEMDWEDTPEAKALAQRAYLMRRGVDVPKGLGYCALHKCDIGAMSFIATPVEFSGKDQEAENAPKCWVGSLGGSV